MLLSRISSPVLSVLCFVGHDPYDKPTEQPESWWQHARDMINKSKNDGDTVLCFMDANAQVGDEVTQSFGGFGGVCTTKTGEFFKDWVHNMDLFVPSTYAIFNAKDAVSDNATFQPHAGGDPKRIDYICMLRDIVMQPTSMHVDTSFDMFNRGADHRPLFCTLRCEAKIFKGTSWRRRKVGYDRNGVNDLVKLQAYRHYVTAAPKIHYDVEPTTHQHMLSEYLRAGLRPIFGPPRKPKRQKYITDATHQLITNMGEFQKKANAKGRSIKRAPLFFCFNWWARKCWRCEWSMVTGFLPRQVFSEWRLAHAMHAEARTEVNGYLLLEKNAHVAAIADDAERALEIGDSSAMHAAVRSLQPWKLYRKNPSATTRRVTDDQGNPATSYTYEREVFRQHFSNLLGGTTMQFAEAIQKERNYYTQRMHVPMRDAPRASSIPTPSEIMKLIGVSKFKKAVGEDLLGGEIFGKCRYEMAKLFHPLFVKSILQVRPPMQYRGGMAAELYNGKGPQSDTSSYRDVCLADFSAKIFGRWEDKD